MCVCVFALNHFPLRLGLVRDSLKFVLREIENGEKLMQELIFI